MEGIEKETWHPCNRVLPPRPGRYLVYFLYQDAVFVSYWNGKRWEQDGWQSITHWAHLLEKPQDAREVALDMGALIVKDD